MKKREKSELLFQKALNYFPGGVNSPVRAFKAIGEKPIFFEKGAKDILWDVDGNQYIDYCCSWGPLINGHSHPYIEEKIIETLKKGSTFGAPTAKENELAQLILKNHRFLEKIRFVSSGTEAVMSVLRLARGFTRKNKIIKFEGCYHGHFDGLLVAAGSGLATLGNPSSEGVIPNYIKDTLILPLGDLERLEKAIDENKNEIAALLIEPIPANNGLLLQGKDFLEALRKICDREGILLIFDEVISGFRVNFEGAAGFYEIQPDLFAFGKIMGGGLPAGAYGGKKQIMEKIAPAGKIYQAGTLSGNPLAMAAGKAQLELCLETDFYKNLEKKTFFLKENLEKIAKEKDFPFQMTAICGLFWLNFSRGTIYKSEQIQTESINYFNAFYKKILEKGVYLGPSGYEVGFVSAVHTEENLEKTVTIFTETLGEIF